MPSSSLRSFAPTNLLAAMFATAVVSLSMPAFAQDEAPPEPTAQLCAANPAKCEQMKQARDAYCAKSPATCAAADERRANRKAYCAENPGQCDDLKAEAAARKQAAKDYCAQDPEACEQKKTEMRQKQDARIQKRRDTVDSQ